MRQFESGATRDDDSDKIDYEGFLSPKVLAAYGRYMHRHRMQADGKLRASDNWKKGIPRDQYMKSMFRHFMELWALHELNAFYLDKNGVGQEALYALLFNVMGYAHELENGR